MRNRDYTVHMSNGIQYNITADDHQKFNDIHFVELDAEILIRYKLDDNKKMTVFINILHVEEIATFTEYNYSVYVQKGSD